MAASDTSGTLQDPEGLDVGALIALKDAGEPLSAHPRGKKLDGDAIIDVECDIWIPAARPDVIHAGNVGRLQHADRGSGRQYPLYAEGRKDRWRSAACWCFPDFIANAGGVICAAIEYHGGTEATAFTVIEEKIRANTSAVLAEAKRVKSLAARGGVGARRAPHPRRHDPAALGSTGRVD